MKLSLIRSKYDSHEFGLTLWYRKGEWELLLSLGRRRLGVERRID